MFEPLTTYWCITSDIHRNGIILISNKCFIFYIKIIFFKLKFKCSLTFNQAVMFVIKSCCMSQ